MKCPHCGSGYGEGARECPICGMSLEAAPAPRTITAPRRSQAPSLDQGTARVQKLLVGMLLLGIGSLSYWAFFAPKSPKKDPPPRPQPDKTLKRSPRPAPQRPADLPEDARWPPPELRPLPKPPPPKPTDYSWMEPLVAEINTEGASLGVAVTFWDLEPYLQKADTILDSGRFYLFLDDLHLPEPETMPFTAMERWKLPRGTGGREPRAKCRVRGEWVYYDDVPATREGISECWKRGFGDRDENGVIVINTWLDHWVRYHWHKRFGKWDRRTEEDAVRGYRYMLKKEYSPVREKRERREFDEKKPFLQRKSRETKRELIASFNTRIIRTIVEHRLDQPVP